MVSKLCGVWLGGKFAGAFRCGSVFEWVCDGFGGGFLTSSLLITSLNSRFIRCAAIFAITGLCLDHEILEHNRVFVIWVGLFRRLGWVWVWPKLPKWFLPDWLSHFVIYCEVRWITCCHLVFCWHGCQLQTCFFFLGGSFKRQTFAELLIYCFSIKGRDS